METYKYKPKYYLSSGVDADVNGYKKLYISPLNKNGDGSELNPLSTLTYTNGTNNSFLLILANGIYRRWSAAISSTNQNSYMDWVIIGQCIFGTVLSPIINTKFTANNSARNVALKDLTITNWDVIGGGATVFNCYRCYIKDIPNYSTNVYKINTNRCIVQLPNNFTNYTDQGQNSYDSTDIVNTINSLALYGNCNVTLDTQARLTTYLSTYAAFNDCKFKIGNEPDWTPLNGATEAEYRADFVARCQAQGWTVPAGTEFGDTNMPMYRWVFAGNSSKNGVPVLNGIIHNFEKRRFVTFGYETKRMGIVVSTNPAAGNSFNPATPGTVLELSDNAMTFPAGQDITYRAAGTKQSNIMWLGGKMKLTALDIVHNMPVEFGIMLDNTSTIDFTPVASGSIQPDELYIVRSTDKQYAAITYNGVAYNTSLANNAQVFKGVAGQTGFAVASGNPVIYRITDFVQHQTINMRIVNKLPADIIRSGKLNADYWYFVEHDTDQNNTTDYVTYKGVNYPALSSFLCDAGDLTFAVSGNIHLRRCWHKDYDPSTESVDAGFWANEQKPKWCKLVLGDTPRCFMVANNNRQNEMQADEYGEYLTTGNPAFYRKENGDGGIAIPSFPVQGTYIQFSIEATTINPM